MIRLLARAVAASVFIACAAGCGSSEPGTAATAVSIDDANLDLPPNSAECTTKISDEVLRTIDADLDPSIIDSEYGSGTPLVGPLRQLIGAAASHSGELGVEGTKQYVHDRSSEICANAELRNAVLHAAPGDKNYSVPDTTPPSTIPAPPTTAAPSPTTNAQPTTTAATNPPVVTLPASTLPQPAAPITVSCVRPYLANERLPLKPCQKGDAIARVQKALNNLGVGFDITADGEYGQATADAVQSFQFGANLPQTGVVDEATWAALGL